MSIEADIAKETINRQLDELTAMRERAEKAEADWRKQYALTCFYIEDAGPMEQALGQLVDAVNVEFPGGMRDIGGKTGPALINAVNVLAKVNSPERNGPVPKRLVELRRLVDAESRLAATERKRLATVEAAKHYLANDGSRGVYDAVKLSKARSELEQALAAQQDAPRIKS